MKLNKHVVILTIVITMLTVTVYAWAHGLNNVIVSITALLILGGLVHMFSLRVATLQPQQVLGEAVESGQANGN